MTQQILLVKRKEKVTAIERQFKTNANLRYEKEIEIERDTEIKIETETKTRANTHTKSPAMGNAISKCREQRAECSAHFISKHFIYFTYSNNNVVRHRMLHFLYDLGLQLEGHYDENGNMCRVLCAKFMIHARLERAYCNFTKYPKTSNTKTKRSKQIEMVLTDGTNKRTNQPIT